MRILWGAVGLWVILISALVATQETRINQAVSLANQGYVRVGGEVWKMRRMQSFGITRKEQFPVYVQEN